MGVDVFSWIYSWYSIFGAGIAQSVYRLATDWTVWGSNPVRGEIPDRLWGPPSLLYKGYRVFPVGKAAGVRC
jgi:hypothetical protein